MAENEYNEIKEKLDRIERLALISAKEVLSLDECVLLTGYSKAYLYRLTSQRKVPFYKPIGGTIFFKKSEIEEWLLQNRQATDAEVCSRATTYCKTKKKINPNLNA